jgi:hypothetical protein
VSSKTILVVAALVAVALSASGCGGKSESAVARCVEKKGLVVRHQKLRIRDVSGGLPFNGHYIGGSGPLHVTTSVAPALAVRMQRNRVTIVFAKSGDQAFDAGLAVSGATLTVEYAGHVAGVWDRRPSKDEARLVEGCLS